MLNLVLFGPPGAGKGTQSEKLIEKYKLIHLSTGNLLRSEIEKQTLLGKEAKKLMDQGVLVPDEVVNEIIGNLLDINKDTPGFIFDGYPRTTAQAEALDALLARRGLTISQMISLEVDDVELQTRLLLRGKNSSRPDDANPEIIQKRIAEYTTKTAVVAHFYKKQNKFTNVSGMGNIDTIFFSICQVIDRLKEVKESSR